MDTRIKLSDIDEAIRKASQDRSALVGTSPISTEDLFMRLPPEIRNRIYELVLGVGTISRRTYQVPQPPFYGAPAAKNTLFRLSKQINTEARSVLTAQNVAYIPILAKMDFTELCKAIGTNGLASVSPVRNTIFNALTTFKHVHLHCHTNARWSNDPTDLVPLIDGGFFYLLARLRQALLIFMRGTALNFAPSRGSGDTHTKQSQQRTCTIHLDHMFSDWIHMNRDGGPFTFFEVLSKLRQDPHTRFELRHYVYTGTSARSTFGSAAAAAAAAGPNAHVWQDWEQGCNIDYQKLKGLCARVRVDNLTLVSEVYGKLKWRKEDSAEQITREITPSSRLWPSWPDDVPWRMFPRVPSNWPVSDEEFTEA